MIQICTQPIQIIKFDLCSDNSLISIQPENEKKNYGLIFSDSFYKEIKDEIAPKK